VKQLFVAMGAEAWTTIPSKDGGVDAVATSRHLFFGGVCLIQAAPRRSAPGRGQRRQVPQRQPGRARARSVLFRALRCEPGSERCSYVCQGLFRFRFRPSGLV